MKALGSQQRESYILLLLQVYSRCRHLRCSRGNPVKVQGVTHAYGETNGRNATSGVSNCPTTRKQPRTQLCNSLTLSLRSVAISFFFFCQFFVFLFFLLGVACQSADVLQPFQAGKGSPYQIGLLLIYDCCVPDSLLTSPSDRILCPIGIQYALFSSDTIHCPIVKSKSVGSDGN